MIKPEEIIGYEFKDKNLIKTAFIHSSYGHEKHIEYNERLEFLGDAVLEIVVSEYLYLCYPELQEGEMTKVRASVVCEKSLAKIADKHNFSNFLLVSKSENIGNNGKRRPSTLADCVEAVIGAIYLDGGYEAAKEFVLKNLIVHIKEAINGLWIIDYKTYLQEIIQKEPNNKLKYEVEKTEGPDHDKTFFTSALLNGEIIGSGCGKTKKESEQNAAKEAVERFINEK